MDRLVRSGVLARLGHCGLWEKMKRVKVEEISRLLV